MSVRPGHPVGEWTFIPEPRRKEPPTARELRDVFDEQSVLDDLSADSWLALRRLGEVMEGEPAAFGTLVCFPDPREFDPYMLEHLLDDGRFDALTGGATEPTEEERSLWMSVYMERASNEDTPALNCLVGWDVSDDLGRQRVLITYREDRGLFGGVAGLYLSRDQASAALSAYGDLVWCW